MKPELRPVVLGLVIAGFAFAVVLAIVRVHPADLEAPGLKFVSPGIVEFFPVPMSQDKEQWGMTRGKGAEILSSTHERS
jgi:hypothetical protein